MSITLHPTTFPTTSQLSPSEWRAPALASLSTHMGRTWYSRRVETFLETFVTILVRALPRQFTVESAGFSLPQTTSQSSIPTGQLYSGYWRIIRESNRKCVGLIIIKISNWPIADQAIRVHHQAWRSSLLPARLVARHAQYRHSGFYFYFSQSVI